MRREHVALIAAAALFGGAMWLVRSPAARGGRGSAGFQPVPGAVLTAPPVAVAPAMLVPPGWIEVRGQILLNGKPWACARIAVEEDLDEARILELNGWRPWTSGSSIDADDEARFVVAVPCAGTYWIHASSPPGEEWTTLLSRFEVGSEDRHDHVFNLGAARISGRVLGPKGEPVPRIRVGAGAEHLFSVPGFEEVMGSEDARGTGYAWADESGHYSLLVPAGRLTISAPNPAPGEANDGRPFLGTCKRLVVAEGADLTGVDLELELGAQVAGRVRRQDGSTVPRASVWVWIPSAKQPFELALSDRDGSFLATFYPGPVQIAAGTSTTHSPWVSVDLEVGRVRNIELVIE